MWWLGFWEVLQLCLVGHHLFSECEKKKILFRQQYTYSMTQWEVMLQGHRNGCTGCVGFFMSLFSYGESIFIYSYFSESFFQSRLM